MFKTRPLVPDEAERIESLIYLKARRGVWPGTVLWFDRGIHFVHGIQNGRGATRPNNTLLELHLDENVAAIEGAAGKGISESKSEVRARRR